MRAYFRAFMVMAVGLLTFAAASASDFASYEGNNAVQVGTGGEKHAVDGVDFWANGAPPRKFKLLGFVTDTRLKTGLLGMMRMHGLESHIAKVAKSVGGDAVILTDAEAVTNGYITNTQTNTTGTANTSGNITANTYGNTTTGTFGATTTAQSQTTSNSYSTVVQHEHTRYAVVKYLDDIAAPVSNTTASTNAKADQAN